MNDMKFLRIEMEGLKASVGAMLQDRNDEIGKIVNDRLSVMLNEEWIVSSIDDALRDCVSKVIENIGSDYRIQSAIKDALASTIVGKISE